jgi:hypothetical protein
VAAGEYLYFLDDDGNTFVLKAGPRFEMVTKNPLEEECYASPAISRSEIFIRTLHNLYCIGHGSKRGQAPLPERPEGCCAQRCLTPF